MIKVFDSKKLYTPKDPEFHIVKQDYLDMKGYFVIYRIAFFYKCKMVLIDFSDRSSIEELINYVEVNGKIFKYKDIHKNPERFRMLLQQDQLIDTIDRNLP